MSVIIGYILLVSFVIIMAAIVYQWMKTYVPKEALDCPDEVSIFIKDATFNCTNSDYTLQIELQNNGRFNIQGYFIRASNSSNPEDLATIDLSGFFNKSSDSEATRAGSMISFGSHEKNSFKPGSDIITHTFNVGSMINSIEIIPTRYQTQDNKERLVSCSGSAVSEDITCS